MSVCDVGVENNVVVSGSACSKGHLYPVGHCNLTGFMDLAEQRRELGKGGGFAALQPVVHQRGTACRCFGVGDKCLGAVLQGGGIEHFKARFDGPVADLGYGLA